MAARVLNKGELRYSLSTVAANAKKKKKRNKSIRNTLTLPAEQFWPEVAESDSTDIRILLEELLPAAKMTCTKKKLKWKILKKMSREERKAYHQELVKATLIPEEKKFLLLGHRTVSRAVEGNHVSCCILCSNVQPRFMLAGILSACQHNSIPIIMLSQLQDITRRTLSFPTMALAFKKCVSESPENKFHPIYKRVTELAKQLSSSFDLHDNISENDEELNSGNKMINGEEQTEENCTKRIDKSEIKTKVTTKPYKYLYLNSDGSRAFIPERERPINIESSRKQMDYISISTDAGDNSNSKPNRKRQFEELEQDLIGSDDEPEDEEMNVDDMFVIDKQSSAAVLQVVEGQNNCVAFPMKKKNNKIKTPRYFPVNIKTVTSNPGKAVKPKKKRRIY